MRVAVIKYNKHIMIKEAKTICFDLLKDVNNNLRYGNNFILKRNDFLVEQTIRNKISWLLSKYNYGNNIQERRKQ